MIKRLLSALLLVAPVHNVWADIDVTELYLSNAGFDDASHFDYRVSDAGNVSQEILPVFGWRKDIGVDYTVTGVYELGTSKTFNTYGKVPSKGYDGKSGGVLALSTGWEQSLMFYQSVELPAGSYKLQAPFYNGSNSSNGGSLLAWVPRAGAAVNSTLSVFPQNAWSLDEVAFSLSVQTEGRVQIGFKGAPNGSANSAKVVVDFVRLIMVGDNAQLIANIRKQLKNTLQEAISVYGAGSGKEAAALKKRIDDGQAAADDASADYAALFIADKRIKEQLVLYKWANSTLASPVDFTASIVNPSFEDKFAGWKQSGFQTQSNTSFAPKDGSVYVEKWVTKGAAVGSAVVSQSLGGDLPLGIYVLKAVAQNIQQDQNANQTGAWLVADNDSVEVTSAKDYALQFTHIDADLSVAFKALNASGNWIAVDNFRLYYAAASMEDYARELAKRVSVAEALANERMNESLRERLLSAINDAKAWLDQPNLAILVSVSSMLKQAVGEVQPSLVAYRALAGEIENAQSQYEKQMKDAEGFAASISAAVSVLEDETLPLAVVDAAVRDLQSAELMFKVANASGVAPVVTTNERVARGATMAFGRASFAGNNIMERGFCWATHPDPLVTDNRSTLSYNNNGAIYVMQGLQPATIYYIRPYAISTSYAVGYGDAVKIATLPMGNVSWTYNNGGSEEENDRINKAVADAVDIWNNLTSINGLHISVSYGASTPTADCSYGGSMRVGPNASYQRTGTIQHEMCHAAGVGTIDRWYNSAVYRENVSGGFWLGERTDQVLCFLENSDDAHLKGDKTHFWPYGVNGANEDDGSRMLYYANALIIQALGEDFLPPVYGAFASPAYTFTQNDDRLYYLIPANSVFGSNIKVLKAGENGGCSIEQKNWKSVLDDDACAWQIRFNPVTQLYEVRNSANGLALANAENQVLGAANESFGIQMLGSRQNVANDYFNMKSYWLVFANGTNQPKTLSANNDGQTVSPASFDHQNSASQQRWILLPKADLKVLAGDYTALDNVGSLNGDIVVTGGQNEFTVETSDLGAWVRVVNVQGALIDRFYVQSKMCVCRPAPAGFLLVNDKKILVGNR
ncbi:MAG: hypothetical protein MJZ24_07400 [Paludibacteraceae bacterium]|nr:hypothetical protein [Paludibacteraceae bacterium]